MRRNQGVGVLLLLFLVAFLPGVAEPAGTISGTVRTLEAPQTPIAGAVVTVAAPDQPPITTTTAANGTFSVATGGSGPYSVSVQATGFATQSARGVQPGMPHVVALDSATFAPLPLHSGSTMTVAADATSGIFYTSMNQAPELYRTVDYGGTWQPVAMRYEDPDTGLNRPAGGLDVVTASSVPGEVAVVTGGKIPGCCGGVVFGNRVHFSTDYGVTWRTIEGLLQLQGQPFRSHFLFWGHASPTSPNVLIVARADAGGSWHVWRADMSAAAPTFVKEPTDPFGAGSVIAGADSASGSLMGRLSASGELAFAPLTAAGVGAFGPAVAGLPTPPVMLRLGGAKDGGAPPYGALVAGGSGPPYTAHLLTKEPGATSFVGGSISEPTPVPSGCRFLEGYFDQPTGSVAPTTSADSGSGSVGQCWVTWSGTGSLTSYQTCCEARDVAYDRNWGAGNHVLIRAGSSGLVKFARLDENGVPGSFGGAIALPGTDPSSGGLSVQGMVSPVVQDTAYGPVGAQQLAVAVSSSGGQLSLASLNGGQSFTPVLNRGFGANQVRWWQGPSGQWLVFGHGQGPGQQLSAVLNWDGASSIGAPNVIGSRPEDLGMPPGSGVTSLHEVPGTDTVFLAVTTGVAAFDPNVGSEGHLFRARLVPGNPPSLSDVFSFDPALAGTTLYLPQAMAYCPSSSTNSGMQDVLFVATGVPDSESKGSLLRIRSATSGAPAVSEISSIPHGTPRTLLRDVRVDCSQGVVYAGGENHGTLYKSTDAGLTFTAITLTGPGGAHMDTIGGITAIGLNPADPNDVKVAAGKGFITHSTDGGSSWTIISDPNIHRPIGVSDIEFPPGGAGPSAVGPSAAAPRPALLGTSSGAFKAELAVSRGLVGVTAAPGGAGRTQTQITALGSDSHPAAVVTLATGNSSAVFRRANALHYVSTSGGSWSLPSEIPGTARGRLPAVALDPAGGLNVVFVRTGAAPGIYVTRRAATGVWSAPRRLSSGAGDTLPEIAMTGAGAGHIAFLRTRGRARGIYYSSSRSGRWAKPAKVRGTRAADASAALGGPSLDAFAGRVHLAFARGGPARGIYYAARRGSRWTAFRRLTRSRDVQPALAVDLKGARHIVFRRASGKRAGLFALRGARRWSLARIAGTSRRDVEPALSLSGSGASVILAFARPSGPTAGVYYDARGLNGRWLPKPRRWSTSAKDRNPSVHSDVRGRLTVVFERG